jgi:glycerol uptake facilitator-like aquaporin
MLAYTVLNTACVAPAKKIWHSSQDPNQFFGLAIGFVIVAGGNAAGWISGGAFNPAGMRP